MIEKERLEELIKQGATIYGKYRDYSLKNREGNSSDFWYKRTAEIKDNKFHYTYEDSDYYEDFDVWLELEQLFETKEEAEWHKEFGCIERTERLVLPTWEEFKNKKIKCVGFTGKETNCFFELYENTPNNRLILLDHDCDFEYFNTVSTKENYTIACRKAKELFLGEE